MAGNASLQTEVTDVEDEVAGQFAKTLTTKATKVHEGKA
jgi:hypothetical protein